MWSGMFVEPPGFAGLAVAQAWPPLHVTGPVRPPGSGTGHTDITSGEREEE